MIKLAQIGCGYWGPNLLRNFSATPGCEVKYVVEASVERRKFVEANYPRTSAVADLSVVMNDPEVSAVVIATPATTHFGIGKQALECGKHIFVEKPLAMSVAEVDELTELAATQKLTVMVGHTFLYHPAVNYLKRLIDKGELGRIYYIYTQRLNLGVVRADVNAMWNLAPHDISILCYLLGKTPLSVSASGSAYLQPGIEDVVFMNLRFPDQVQANVHVSWLDPNKVRRSTVVGSKKMVVYDDVADDKITIYDKGIDLQNGENGMPFDTVTAGKLIHRAGDIHIPKITFKEPLRIEAQHFLDCITTREEPITGAAHGRQVVSILAAGQASLSNGGLRFEIQT